MAKPGPKPQDWDPRIWRVLKENAKGVGIKPACKLIDPENWTSLHREFYRRKDEGTLPPELPVPRAAKEAAIEAKARCRDLPTRCRRPRVHHEDLRSDDRESHRVLLLLHLLQPLQQAVRRRIYDHLQARGIRCWLDEHQMKIGDKILPGILNAIRLHDTVLLCCSEDSLQSKWVVREIETALQREIREERLLLLPRNLDGYLFDGYDGTYQDELQSRLAANFKGWEADNEKFENQFERVVQALRTERDQGPEPKL